LSEHPEITLRRGRLSVRTMSDWILSTLPALHVPLPDLPLRRFVVVGVVRIRSRPAARSRRPNEAAGEVPAAPAEIEIQAA
jgi:hypothetical protein